MERVRRALFVAAYEDGLSPLAAVDTDRLLCRVALILFVPNPSACGAGQNGGILSMVGRVIRKPEQSRARFDLLVDMRLHLLFETTAIGANVVLHVGEQ